MIIYTQVFQNARRAGKHYRQKLLEQFVLAYNPNMTLLRVTPEGNWLEKYADGKLVDRKLYTPPAPKTTIDEATYYD